MKIKDYLKRVDELGAKLTGEDKETYNWLIHGFNQCAKLLNETEQQCQKYKEVIDKARDLIEKLVTTDIGIDSNNITHYHQLTEDETGELLDILKEVE